MRRRLNFLGTTVVASAACFLAYLVAEFFVLQVPNLLLAALTDVQWEVTLLHPRIPHFLPQLRMQAPSDGSPLLHVLYHGGFLLSGAAVLLLGIPVMRRARGWWRLFLTQAIFWACVFIVLYSGLFVGWRAPLHRTLSVLRPDQAVSTVLLTGAATAITAMALLAAFWFFRGLLDSAAETRRARLVRLAAWLLLPCALVGALLIVHLFSWQTLLRSRFTLSVLLWITAHALLAGLPAALWPSRPAPALQLRVRGALILLLVFGLAFGSLSARTELARYAARRDFSRRTSQYWVLQFDRSALEQAQSASFAAKADERLAALAGRLGLELPNSKLRANFYASTDAKTVVAGDDEPFTVDAERREVHHLLAPAGDITDARGDALLLMQAAWGDSGSEAVARALARFAVGHFHGHALNDYAGRIAREEVPYTLREILQLGTDYLSPLVRDALGGAWVEFTLEGRDREVLPALYRTPLEAGKEAVFARVLGASWEELEHDWRSFLLEATAARERPRAGASSPPAFFHRGISFSHEVAGNWGYGSDRAREQLKRIRELGANSVALVPYAFTRAPRETRIYFGTDERDHRVIRAIETARRLGLHTMLKPQLWGSGFTGDIVFENDADFERWFGLYRRWLLHFARLAELHRVDLLVIGTELTGVTGHEAAWRALIADLRRIYGGPLTYASTWGSEFERLPFWDALDYLGVNMYYPLAAPGETPRGNSPRLQELVERFAALARHHDKPVLFTEVGYAAIATAAAEPWAERSAPLDAELQKRCYETIFDAFYAQPWFAGLYWWKWPSHGSGSRFSRSHNPLGKPALEVVEHWYGQPSARQEIGWPPKARYTHRME